MRKEKAIVFCASPKNERWNRYMLYPCAEREKSLKDPSTCPPRGVGLRAVIIPPPGVGGFTKGWAGGEESIISIFFLSSITLTA